MPLIVGNSIVKHWTDDEAGPIKVICVPGAALISLVVVGEDNSEPGELLIIQSGIPDIHVKGVRDINTNKLEYYRDSFTHTQQTHTTNTHSTTIAHHARTQ